MNKKHAYLLKGITEEQISIWKESIRDDLTIINRNGIIISIINLTLLESVKMKFQMIYSNIRYNYGFKLIRI